MFASFIAPFIVASVVLVPKTGNFDKKQTDITQETIQGEEAAPKSKVKKDKEEKEGVIVLRKTKKPKVAKSKKGKKKGKDIQEVVAPKTEFDDENMDDIYRKERQYFKTGKGISKKNPTGVNGALASIPAAVADSIAKNLLEAKKARAPATPPPPPVKEEPKTAEQMLDVEETIQEKRKIAKEEPAKKENDKKEKEKIVEAPKPKKVKPAKEIKPEPKVDRQAAIKAELQAEVQAAEVEQIISEKPEKKSKREPSAIAEESPKKILKKIEEKYITHFVKIDVKSEVTQALLDRTKTYSGNLFIAPEGRFKMEVKEPNKHMLLMNGKNIWVVDYPLDGTQDKVQILHSKSAKNLKNQAFLSIFMGVGNLEKSFKVESSEKKNDEITYKLIPKQKDDQVERVELKVDHQAELITAITFWDSLGNKTQLKFTEQNFEDKTPKDIFKFKPPKDSDITYL